MISPGSGVPFCLPPSDKLFGQESSVHSPVASEVSVNFTQFSSRLAKAKDIWLHAQGHLISQ